MNDFKYLNDTVWCRIGVSSLHGVGVIAIRDIPKGTKLTDYSLDDMKKRIKYPTFCMTHNEFLQIRPEIRSLILDRIILHERYNANYIEFISPNHDQILQSFMNHAKEPNSNGEVALRDIKAGEEVTENFHKVVGNEMHGISRAYFTFL